MTGSCKDLRATVLRSHLGRRETSLRGHQSRPLNTYHGHRSDKCPYIMHQCPLCENEDRTETPTQHQPCFDTTQLRYKGSTVCHITHAAAGMETPTEGYRQACNTMYPPHEQMPSVTLPSAARAFRTPSSLVPPNVTTRSGTLRAPEAPMSAGDMDDIDWPTHFSSTTLDRQQPRAEKTNELLAGCIVMPESYADSRSREEKGSCTATEDQDHDDSSLGLETSSATESLQETTTTRQLRPRVPNGIPPPRVGITKEPLHGQRRSQRRNKRLRRGMKRVTRHR